MTVNLETKMNELIELRNPEVAPVISTLRGHIPASELTISTHWSASEKDLVCAVEYRLTKDGKDSPYIRRDVYVHLKKGAELGAKLAKIG